MVPGAGEQGTLNLVPELYTEEWEEQDTRPAPQRLDEQPPAPPGLQEQPAAGFSVRFTDLERGRVGSAAGDLSYTSGTSKQFLYNSSLDSFEPKSRK